MSDPTAAARTLIAELLEYREQQTVAGGSWWEAPEICTQAADAIATLANALDTERARAEKAEAERDQALARLAAVQDRMRTSAAMHVLSASLCPRNLEADRSYLVNKIRALPIDPDAEAALQRVVDARMGPALEACQIIDSAVREGHDNTSDLILHLLTAVEPARAALKRPETSHE